MCQSTGLDEWPGLESSTLGIPLNNLCLLGKKQNEPRTDAIPGRIDAITTLDGVCVLLPGSIDHLVQDRHDAVLSDAGEPHVDEERLCNLDGFQLELLEDRCGVVGDGGCAWSCVAGEEVGHEDEVALRGELVGLDLVVGGLDARASSEEEEESRRSMRVVGGLGDVDLEVSAVSDSIDGVTGWSHINAIELDDLAGRGLSRSYTC
jgi:hypothetical protein